jgi:glycosyltransferase involved in cell wall biosynthesis
MLEALTLVVPCYNEASRFDAGRFGEALGRFPGLQLLLVNDGSSDATEAVISAFAATSAGRVRTLSLAENCGKAEAVRVGMGAALDGGAGWVGFWDADLATPLAALEEFSAAAALDWVARTAAGQGDRPQSGSPCAGSDVRDGGLCDARSACVRHAVRCEDFPGR